MESCTTIILSIGTNPHQFGHPRWKCVNCKLERSQVVIFALDTHWVAHGTTSHNSSKPSKNPTCLVYGFYICYFDPHDSGQHPKLVHTFHPRRLPPSGLQTHENIIWQPILDCMST